MRIKVFLVLAGLLVGLMPLRASAVESPWIASLPAKHLSRNFVSAFPNGTVYVLQQEWGEGLQLFRSSDFGVTWSVQPPLPEDGIAMAGFVSPKHGVLVLNNTLYRTTDGAGTWTRFQRPWKGSANIDFLEVTEQARTVVIGVREWREPDGDIWYDDGAAERECHDPRQDRLEVFISADLGRTWGHHVVRSEAPVFGSGADFFNERHGLVTVSADVLYARMEGECAYAADVATGRRVLMTTDGGRTFKKIYQCPEDDSCLAVSNPSPRHAVIGTTDGDLSITFDGGRTFEAVRLDGLVEAPTVSDDYRWVYDIDFAGPKVGFASTNGRGLWRTVDGGRTWVREASPLDAPGWQFPGAGRISAADPTHAVVVAPPLIATRLP